MTTDIPHDDENQNNFDNNNNNNNPDVNWFRIHRSMYTGPLYGRGDLQALWVLLISEAEWKTHKRGIKTYKRGTYYYGLNKIRSILGCCKRKLKRDIEELESHGFIKRKKTLVKQHEQYEVTICNYDKYQGGREHQGALEGSLEGSLKDAKRDYSKELKKRKNKELKKGGNTRAHDELPKTPPPINEMWDAYSNAKERAYGVKPLKTPKQIIQLGQIAELVGFEHASEFVSFYVTCGTDFYKSKAHDLKFCLEDVDKINTAFQQRLKKRS